MPKIDIYNGCCNINAEKERVRRSGYCSEYTQLPDVVFERVCRNCKHFIDDEEEK